MEVIFSTDHVSIKNSSICPKIHIPTSKHVFFYTAAPTATRSSNEGYEVFSPSPSETLLAETFRPITKHGHAEFGTALQKHELPEAVLLSPYIPIFKTSRAYLMLLIQASICLSRADFKGIISHIPFNFKSYTIRGGIVPYGLVGLETIDIAIAQCDTVEPDYRIGQRSSLWSQKWFENAYGASFSTADSGFSRNAHGSSPYPRRLRQEDG